MTLAAVVQFPGSNCETESVRAVERAGGGAEIVWHRTTDLRRFDAVIIPGGFSYGDYLRAGAIARFSPVMTAVVDFARSGGPVLGICNGFQILCEVGLLPGALLPNAGLRFVSRPVTVRIESAGTPFTCAYETGNVIEIPVAHGEGRYVTDEADLARLEAEGRIVMRYVSRNPNGSVADIAAVCNTGRNVVGMMPHPERAADQTVRNTAGQGVFQSLVAAATVAEGA